LAHNFLFLTATKRDIPGGEKPNVTIRATVRALLFAPFWVLAIVVLSDALSLYLPMLVQMNATNSLWDTLNTSERIEAVLRTVFCAIIAAYIFTICRDTDEFQSDTVRQLENIRNHTEPVIPEAVGAENTGHSHQSCRT
jgi:hypothetical protein